jgi:ribulose-phosphate 3-epimerase
MEFNKKYISASIICSDFIDLKKDIELIEDGGADFIHVDMMDGHFVPRLGIFPEILGSIKSLTKKVSLDVHLMTERPLDWLPVLYKYNPEYITVHVESTKHLHYVIQNIKENGIKAGVALNPATPINSLDYLVDDLDLVMVMAINPGIVGHKFIPNMIEKIENLSKYRKDNKAQFLIEVDGGVSFESAPKMIKAGADILVCGSSTIFNQEKPLNIKLNEFIDVLKNSNG